MRIEQYKCNVCGDCVEEADLCGFCTNANNLNYAHLFRVEPHKTNIHICNKCVKALAKLCGGGAIESIKYDKFTVEP